MFGKKKKKKEQQRRDKEAQHRKQILTDDQIITNQGKYDPTFTVLDGNKNTGYDFSSDGLDSDSSDAGGDTDGGGSNSSF